MAYGIRLKVWGQYACFTRPEMKVERVSYDVMTPSAARGVLEAIYFKPAIRWRIKNIHVLNPIQFTNIRRNEVGSKVVSPTEAAMRGEPVAPMGLDITGDRQQRATLMLRDVAYVIEAAFEMTDQAGPDDTEEKHYNMALRRIRKGQCFHQPYLGCREFPASFAPVDEIPSLYYARDGERDLGWMLLDIDFAHEMTPRFFRASMEDGIIRVPPMPEGGMAG